MRRGGLGLDKRIVEVRLLGLGDPHVLAVLPRQVRWAGGVAGAAVAKCFAWPGKVQGVMGGGTKACIAGVRWRWGAVVEKVVDEMDWGETL